MFTPLSRVPPFNTREVAGLVWGFVAFGTIAGLSVVALYKSFADSTAAPTGRARHIQPRLLSRIQRRRRIAAMARGVAARTQAKPAYQSRLSRHWLRSGRLRLSQSSLPEPTGQETHAACTPAAAPSILTSTAITAPFLPICEPITAAGSERTPVGCITSTLITGRNIAGTQ